MTDAESDFCSELAKYFNKGEQSKNVSHTIYRLMLFLAPSKNVSLIMIVLWDMDITSSAAITWRCFIVPHLKNEIQQE